MIAAESNLEARRNKSHCKEYSTIFDAFYRIQLDDRCIGILTNECFIVFACTAFATPGVYFDRIGFLCAWTHANCSWHIYVSCLEKTGIYIFVERSLAYHEFISVIQINMMKGLPLDQ